MTSPGPMRLAAINCVRLPPDSCGIDWQYRGEAHPDIICQNPAATLTETVNGGCALQEKGSLVNCVKVKNTHSVDLIAA